MATVTTLIQPAEIVNTGILSAAPLNSRFDASKLSSVVHLAEDRFFPAADVWFLFHHRLPTEWTALRDPHANPDGHR